jgi:restriction system protein
VSRSSFGASTRRLLRAAAAAERAGQNEAVRARKAEERAAALREREARFGARAAAIEYANSRLEEAAELTRDLETREREIMGLLAAALDRDQRFNFRDLRETFVRARFDASKWPMTRPLWADYEPLAPRGFAKLIPGASGRYQLRCNEAKTRYNTDLSKYHGQAFEREKALSEHNADEKQRGNDAIAHNKVIDDLQAGLSTNNHAAFIEYFKILIGKSLASEYDAITAEIGYSPDSQHLVVDLELPEINVVPENSGFKYVKSVDRLDPQPRPINKRRLLYANMINQSILKCVDTVFRGGSEVSIETLTLNGMLDTIDPSTGQPIRVCLISVRVSAEVFKSLNLRHVQPEQCLRSLRASVSRSPAELLPVKPLVEIDMVDPRFIETGDVLSELDQRPNLMELTPGEFEGLITNLFASMGLETRQTQASRDGGVDCVAFDLRPIFGGKVVIQAKRYKNTVGVSSVRDLFGTVQNEGANRGILVTTSGYGRASHDFAKGKPLELIDGQGLLYLLAEHAKIEAKIIMPSGSGEQPSDDF